MAKKTKSAATTRNWDIEIQEKNNATRIEALRRIYGTEFARGYPSNAKLASLLKDSDVRSLGEYLKRSR